MIKRAEDTETGLLVVVPADTVGEAAAVDQQSLHRGANLDLLISPTKVGEKPFIFG